MWMCSFFPDDGSSKKRKPTETESSPSDNRVVKQSKYTKRQDSDVSFFSFLLDLLLSPQHVNAISWTGNGRQFAIHSISDIGRLYMSPRGLDSTVVRELLIGCEKSGVIRSIPSEKEGPLLYDIEPSTYLNGHTDESLSDFIRKYQVPILSHSYIYATCKPISESDWPTVHPVVTPVIRMERESKKRKEKKKKEKKKKVEKSEKRNNPAFDPNAILDENRKLFKTYNYSGADRRIFWFFLLKLLMRKEMRGVLAWTGRAREFCIHDPATIRSLWAEEQKYKNEEVQWDSVCLLLGNGFKARIIMPVDVITNRYAYITEPCIHIGLTRHQLDEYIDTYKVPFLEGVSTDPLYPTPPPEDYSNNSMHSSPTSFPVSHPFPSPIFPFSSCSFNMFDWTKPSSLSSLPFPSYFPPVSSLPQIPSFPHVPTYPQVAFFDFPDSTFSSLSSLSQVPSFSPVSTVSPVQPLPVSSNDSLPPVIAAAPFTNTKKDHQLPFSIDRILS